MVKTMGKSFYCGTKEFIPYSTVGVIAELGTAHNGSLQKAIQLIDAAVDSGADAVKFQIVYADEILHPKTGFVNLPGGLISLYEKFRSVEFPISFYEKLCEYCYKRNVLFLASPFGKKSCQELANLHPACIKIASPELNYIQLLEEATKTGLPLILSTGVSKLRDIEKALETIYDTQPDTQVALLHCITSYPAPEHEYNVSLLELFAPLFDVAVGISDHSRNEYLVPLLSMYCGGCIIEKHFCLSNDDDGLDDKIALSPEQFAKMVKMVKDCQNKSKDEIFEVLLSLGFNTERITATLGTGKKVLAHSEKENYGRTNRCLHYMRDLNKGHLLTNSDIGILRTEKVLTVGELPECIDMFIGATLQVDVHSGNGAQFSDIIVKGNKYE